MIRELFIKEQVGFDEWFAADGISGEAVHIGGKKECSGHIFADEPFPVGSMIEIRATMIISQSTSQIATNKEIVIHKAELIGAEPIEIKGLFDSTALFSPGTKPLPTADLEEVLKKADFEFALKQKQMETPPLKLTPQVYAKFLLDNATEQEQSKKEEVEQEKKKKAEKMNRFTGFADNGFKEL